VGDGKNFDCIFRFRVKSYVRNTINRSYVKTFFPSVILAVPDILNDRDAASLAAKQSEQMTDNVIKTSLGMWRRVGEWVVPEISKNRAVSVVTGKAIQPAVTRVMQDSQDRPLGGASGALAPGTDFEGAPKRRSPTGHTLIRSTVAWWFPDMQTKRVAKGFCF
jgi:hypothetical protein